jgi:hypothetical protein
MCVGHLACQAATRGFRDNGRPSSRFVEHHPEEINYLAVISIPFSDTLLIGPVICSG